MSFAALLTHRMTVYRRPDASSPAGKDPLGQPLTGKADYSATGPAVPCRMTRGRGGRRNGERMQDVVIEDYEILTVPGVDVREQDRVKVTDALGKTLTEDALVTLVRPTTGGRGIEHHREVLVEVQRSGTTRFA